MLIKTLRNTGFTLIVLGLAAVALSWNHRVVLEKMTSLQAASPIVSSLTVKNDLPLQVYTETSPLKIGDTVTITILTTANANLNIKLTSSQASATPIVATAQADSQGYYVYQHKMDDYNFVGRFGIGVAASLGGSEASRTTSLILDTWGGSLSDQLPQTSYSHPLVP